MYSLIVVGGGAAGFFAALQAAKRNPSSKIAILEKSARLLSKVRISGGGRCNVTHHCFDPAVLCTYYPRGFKELRGPFERFQPKDTIAWFKERNVGLKTEEDGRMFPITDDSSTIIDCLLGEAKRLDIEIYLRHAPQSIERIEGGFQVDGFQTKRLLLATGSSSEGYQWAKKFGHTLIPPVPSLFTFNVPSSSLLSLSGVSLDPVRLTLGKSDFSQTGPLLLTHFGFSGPAVLKLSAWAARFLAEKNYQTTLFISWLPTHREEEIFRTLLQLKQESGQKTLVSLHPFSLPKNLWRALVKEEKKMGDISLKTLHQLSQRLTRDSYEIEGKTTHKEEFVTCGGVCLKEIDFKTMESKLCPGLYFAGEILNIDGVTGGFNFQAAWTTGFLAGTVLDSV